MSRRIKDKQLQKEGVANSRNLATIEHIEKANEDANVRARFERHYENKVLQELILFDVA